MSDDLNSRADDYEHRLAAAGSTESIIGGLIKGVEQNRRVTKYLIISLILDVILSLSLAGLTFFAFSNDKKTDADAKAACVQSAKNSIVINNFLNLLTDNAINSSVFTPKEAKTRIAGYQKLKIAIPNCK